MTEETDTIRPRVGISACVLGEPVRFDGGHKRDQFVTKVLGELVDFVSVCPEMEVGMGTPRPTLRLLFDSEQGIRMVESKLGIDHTEAMNGRRAKAQGRAVEEPPFGSASLRLLNGNLVS